MSTTKRKRHTRNLRLEGTTPPPEHNDRVAFTRAARRFSRQLREMQTAFRLFAQAVDSIGQAAR
jgi:hypothetical protein